MNLDSEAFEILETQNYYPNTKILHSVNNSIESRQTESLLK